MADEEKRGDTPPSGWLPPAPGPGERPVHGPAPARGEPAPGESGAFPPPPGYGPQPGYGQQPPPPQQQTPGYWYPQQPQQPQYPQQPYPPGWFPQHGQPGNNTAVTGFILSLAGLVILVFTLGLSTILSLGLCIAGAIVGRKGRIKVDAGETPQHRGLGQAGLIIGIVGSVLSVLAIVGGILVFALADDITDEDNDGDIFDDGDSLNVIGPVVRLIARGVAGL